MPSTGICLSDHGIDLMGGSAGQASQSLQHKLAGLNAALSAASDVLASCAMRVEFAMASEGARRRSGAVATRRWRLDRFEALLLALFAAMSLWVLGLDLWQVVANGRVWTGTDGIYIVDQLQYLAWINAASHHLLASNLFVLRPRRPTTSSPRWRSQGSSRALGVAPWLSLMLWKPVAVVAMFFGARAYVYSSRRLALAAQGGADPGAVLRLLQRHLRLVRRRRRPVARLPVVGLPVRADGAGARWCSRCCATTASRAPARPAGCPAARGGGQPAAPVAGRAVGADPDRRRARCAGGLARLAPGSAAAAARHSARHRPAARLLPGPRPQRPLLGARATGQQAHLRVLVASCWPRRRCIPRPVRLPRPARTFMRADRAAGRSPRWSSTCSRPPPSAPRRCTPSTASRSRSPCSPSQGVRHGAWRRVPTPPAGRRLPVALLTIPATVWVLNSAASSRARRPATPTSSPTTSAGARLPGPRPRPGGRADALLPRDRDPGRTAAARSSATACGRSPTARRARDAQALFDGTLAGAAARAFVLPPAPASCSPTARPAPTSRARSRR